MSVDKNSIEYMFGEIMSRGAQFSEEQQQFRETMGEVTTRLDTLPCARHADDLKRLKGWQEAHNGKVEYTKRRFDNLVIGLVIAVVSSCFGVGCSLLVLRLQGLI